jgi:hypothetical protein
MKTPHPHKDLICQWAEDTSLLIQKEFPVRGKWADCLIGEVVTFSGYTKYRIKPKMISLNGHEYPEPLKEAPEKGTIVFHYGDAEVITHRWLALDWQLKLLKQRRLHLTREAAQQHFGAVIKAGGGEV